MYHIKGVEMSLHIIAGPMFSGKTTSLMNRYEKETQLNKRKVVVIDFDTTPGEYSELLDFQCLKNHDGRTIDNVIITKTLMRIQLSAIIENCDIILVNEAQFFKDLYLFVNYQLDNNKKIYLYGLDGDFEQQPMGHILSLVPMADSFTKLNGKCSNCGKYPSIFSHRIGSSKDKIVIDHNQYIPVCRRCHKYLKQTSDAYAVSKKDQSCNTKNES